MNRLVIALMLSVAATPLGGAAAADGSTFVVLVGYPHAPPGRGLQPLRAVEDDVLNMEAFFRPLAPDALFVHLEATPGLRARRPDLEIHPPTMTALRRTVSDLERRLAAAPAPRRVYVYYAGHGERHRIGAHVRTRLFLARTDGRAPGDDGVLDAPLLTEAILAPLGAHATVHLIADACQSYFLLETRAVTRRRRAYKRHPGADASMAETFAADHPTVGALLATNGSQSTYEDPALGGLFSHALRSAAIGQADFDHDGVVTYREMALALSWILAGRGGASAPGVLAPAADLDAPFIDYRAAPGAAPVVFTPEVAGRYEVLTDDWLPFVTVHPGAAPVQTWFERGRVFRALARVDDTPRWWRYTAGEGDFAEARAPIEAPLARRGDRFARLFPFPIDGARDASPPAPPPAWVPQSYLAVGVLGGVDAFPADGPPGVGAAPSVELSVRLGRGAHHAQLDAGWASWDGTLDGYEGRDVEGQFCAPSQHVRARVSYGYTLIDRRVEVSVGPALGVADVIQRDCHLETQREALLLEGAAGASARLPLPAGGGLALRLDLRGGVQALDIERDAFEVFPIVSGALGIEWETVIE